VDRANGAGSPGGWQCPQGPFGSSELAFVCLVGSGVQLWYDNVPEYTFIRFDHHGEIQALDQRDGNLDYAVVRLFVGSDS
jgi:hypothetical protein